MSYPVPDTWLVTGIMLRDGAPFSQGKLQAYHWLADGSLDWMAECGLAADGAFSLEFSSYMFQKGDTAIDHPNLVVRLLDYDGNLLWESDTFAAMNSPFELGTVDSSAEQDEIWYLEGAVYYNAAKPLSAGLIFVYDVWAGQRILLTQAELNTKGYFNCSYRKSAFQKQGATRTAPNLQIVVRNLQGQNLATYNVPDPVSAHQIVHIQLGEVSEGLTSDVCKVYGTIKNTLGYPLQANLSVAAFCLCYQERTEDSDEKIGSFVKVVLGKPVSPDEFGRYEIAYKASEIPAGLKLDGKAAKGKDKASIFSEIRNGDPNNPKRFFSAPLVFNGKSFQEINFVLDLEADKPTRSEFVALDAVLNIYYKTIISGQSPTIQESEQDKIAEFLKSVTRLPLVIGRESLEEEKVRSYFKAFQLAHELNHEEIIGFEDISKCAEYLYPMVLNSDSCNLSSLLSLGLDECSRIIRSAIENNIVDSFLNVAEFKELVWRRLQASLNAALGQENLFSAFSVFYLFLTKELDLDAVCCRPIFSKVKAGKDFSREIFEKHQALLNAFTEAGCNYYDLIESLKKDGLTVAFKDKNDRERELSLSAFDVEDFSFLIDLSEFCNWYSDLIVSAYTIAKKFDPPINSLKDLLPHNESGFWNEAICATEARYALWCHDAPLALPIDLFPGTTKDEQKEIAARTLKDRLKTKFSREQLISKMESWNFAVDPNEWHTAVEKIKEWKDFDLNASDLDSFLKEHSLSIAKEIEEKIKTVQRLYRLTDIPEAINYLIRNGLHSASEIALVDEERFVAEHGLGLGDKELSTNIHRLAKNFVAGATLDIERYHSSLNESDSAIKSLPRGFQEVRKVSKTAASRTTNVAKQRLQNKSYANWKTLFGSINRNSGTQDQSILSPSAYLLDLLEFLKQGNAYARFIGRRPDIKNLLMTKANAEVPLPTIDLAVELLESLVSQSSAHQKVFPLCNQTPDNATVENLRAIPCDWNPTVSVSGRKVKDLAMAVLADKCYPMNLPKNFDRERAAAILNNLSLDFASVARKLHDENNYSLLLDVKQKEILENSLVGNDDGHVLWGLENFGNENIFFPDKSRKINGPACWYEVLCNLAFILDRAKLTYDEFSEIFVSSVFENSGAELKADSESFQLADVNGYKLYFDNDHSDAKKIDFFLKLSVFVRRRNVLDWSVEEIAKTWNCSVGELADIQELKERLGLTAMEAECLLFSEVSAGKTSDFENSKDILPRECLRKIFPIDALFEAYPESETSVGTAETREKLRFLLAAAAEVCLGMKVQDALSLLEKFWNPSESDLLATAFENGLKILYEYNLWITKNKLSVEEYLFLDRIGFPVEFGSRENCKRTIDQLDLLRNSSLSISDLKSILEPQRMPVAETVSFVLELNAAVRKSLEECCAQEKEISSEDESKNDDSPIRSTAETKITLDYETAILSILKTLGKEEADSVFEAWKEGFKSDDDEQWNVYLNDLLRYVSAHSSWKEVLSDDKTGAVFYEALLEELAFERTLAIVAEKFSLTAEALAELFEKLKDKTLDDLTEWKNFASEKDIPSVNDLNESDLSLMVTLCNRIVCSVALYRFTETWELGFEWDWKQIVSVNEKSPYEKFENVIFAFSASSRILGKVYNYSELANLSASNEKIRISDNAFDALLAASGIDFVRDEKSRAIVSLEVDSPAAWCKFADVLYLYKKTGALPESLQDLLRTDDASYSEYVDAFEKNLEQARTNVEWNEFIQGVNDKIRQLKRDALSAVVCNESQMSDTAAYYPAIFVDEDDIYSYYLFDVKMEPDMAISRTVQAVSCIQLYVQRALMGLEGDYTLNDTQKEQWEWMKNYQVWVANRKVFLYPENWIDGDLRSDKTPFFLELEDRLAEIGDDQGALMEALGEYLKKVCDTSEIDIVGACKQDGESIAGVLYTLHIIGCTRGEPHAYYYRKYEATALYGGSWTPWEELPLEIDGTAVQPAILGGQLHVVWLQVVQGQRQKKTGESGGHQASITVEYYAEIRLKWASFTGTKWTGTKVGKQAVYDISENQLDFILNENENLSDRYFVIDVSDNSDVLNLQLWRTFPDFVDTSHVVTIPAANSTPISGNADGLEEAPATTYILKTEISREYKTGQRINLIGNFSLAQDGSDTAFNQVDPNTGNSISFSAGEFVKNHSPLGCRLVGNIFHHAGGSLVLQDGTKIFGNTRGPFKLLSVNMGFICHEDRPFFYMDSKGVYLIRTVSGDGGAGANSVPNYHVEMMSNSQTGEFRRRFLQGGLKWLYKRETEALPVSDSYYYSYSYYNYYFSVYLGYYTAGDWQAWDLSQTLFEHSYLPSKVVAEPYPSSTVDFCWGSATSIYNWELFFFVPMLLADKMLAEQNYEAALNWIRLVFDPQTDLSSYEKTKRFVRDLSKGARYWNFLPFFANPDADKSILSELSFPSPHDALPDRQAILLLQDRWKNDPFNPQMIARYRPVAYQKYVVMKYLDALIGWGDQLFTQDTTESVNLAVQMYVLAAEILGPKSAEVPGSKNDAAFSVQELMTKGMGVMNNAFITYEDTMLTGKCREKKTPQRLLPGNTMQLMHTTGMMFYFNVPRNEILMDYWDTVADRLYKIRNSLNIEGVKRALALFAPPVDPTLLVKAKASGISISEALADASSVLPYYRFKVMVAKAIEIVRDVMRMGDSLMDALEKYDAESLALLRVSHEKTMLALQKTVTDLDVAELEKELETVETEQENLETERTEQEEFCKPLKLDEQYDKFMEKVEKAQETVENLRKAASVAYKIPDMDVGGLLNGFGGPSFSAIALGGTKIAENLANAAESYASRFVQRQLSAAKMKLQGEAERALQMWMMEKTEKANKAKTLEKKKVVAELKLDYVKKQVEKAEKEIELMDEMYEHLSEKYTGKELYSWLKKASGAIYKSLFQLAVKVARKAEKCYHFEIGDVDENPKTAKSFIKGSGSYWDCLRGGLLAGEKLLADLHTMEVAYLENDKNELEITRPVSLWELENRVVEGVPLQKPLTSLQTAGCCAFKIPEELFASDFPKQYFRRIRDVRLQVVYPEYKGHYLNAQLSLTGNCLDLKGVGEKVCNRVGTQTMATSTAHQENGMYNFSFGTDKFRPFEGAGAINSSWELEITGFDNTRISEPETDHSLDTSKIEDVILYVSYTARMGKIQPQGGTD